MMTCEKCKVLHDKLDAIRAILDDAATVRRGRQAREYATPAGKLIAATASAKGQKLADVSRAAGFAADYVSRVCRGDLPLSRRAAILIGGVLGINLGEYVGDDRATPEQEPGLPLRFAAGVGA